MLLDCGFSSGCFDVPLRRARPNIEISGCATALLALRQKAVDIYLGASANVDRAVGDRRDAELDRISGLITRVLGAVPEFYGEIGGVISVQDSGSTGTGALDGPKYAVG